MIKETKIGEIRKNNFGTDMQIISYGKHGNVRVKFLDTYGYETETIYNNFKKGQIRNPYDKTVYGVGYLGEGDYKVYIDQKHLEPRYNVWRTLLGRCCTERHREQFKAYGNCEVCEEWLNYQVFSKWYEENFYQVGTERMHIDKDILIPGNRLYSPDTCMIVPQRINMLFLHKPNKFGLPNGVKPRAHGKYLAEYKKKFLGVFDSIGEAELAHEEEKKKAITKIAEEYKDKIPTKLYKALLDWKPILKGGNTQCQNSK